MRTIRDGARMGNVQENWVVRLYYGTGSDYLELCDTAMSTASSNALPLITDIGSIRESLDLASCTSKISNLSVTLANIKVDGTLASELLSEIDTAAGVFMNHDVMVRSYLNGNFSNVQTIYTGRLRGISWTAAEVQLDIEPNQPWDFLSIPNVQAASGNWFPVVYGDYTPNTAAGYMPSRALWPMEIDAASNESIWGLAPFAFSTTQYRLHVWEEECDVFVPLEDSAGTAYYVSSADYDASGEAARVDASLIHSWKYKPSRLSESITQDFTNPANAIDTATADESTTYAKATVTSGTAGIYFEIPDSVFPPYDADAGEYQFVITTRLQFSRSGAPTPKLWMTIDGGSSFILEYDSAGTSTVNVTWTVDSGVVDVKRLPTSLGFYFFISGGTTACTLKIYDVRIAVQAQADPDDLKNAKRDKQIVKHLYCGGDGPDGPWTSGPSPASSLQEIHRALLITYAGLSATAPDGYAALDTARSGWSGRLWLHEPEELRKVLEQLQYEGQFVFSWAADGDPKYIFVKSSYSSGDVSATITPGRDTSAIQYGLTPLSDIVSKQELKYERHPADDSRYLSSYTKTNSDRSKYNFDSLENIEQIELDYLVDSVSSHATITDLVFGRPKRLISCQLYRPELFTLEIGDIVQLENDAAYYMITDATRSQGKFTIKAREVG